MVDLRHGDRVLVTAGSFAGKFGTYLSMCGGGKMARVQIDGLPGRSGCTYRHVTARFLQKLATIQSEITPQHCLSSAAVVKETSTTSSKPVSDATHRIRGLEREILTMKGEISSLKKTVESLTQMIAALLAKGHTKALSNLPSVSK